MKKRIMELLSPFQSTQMFLASFHTINVSLPLLILQAVTIYLYKLFHDIIFSVGGITVESGTTIRAAVLDVSKLDRLVDLSLRIEFVNRTKQDSSDAQVSKKVIFYLQLL